jgi:hypothetical protein
LLEFFCDNCQGDIAHPAVFQVFFPATTKKKD